MDKQIAIPLSSIEMFNAASVGITRRLSAVKRNRPSKTINPTLDLWGLDIEAAAAELVVAKWLGRYWHSIVDEPGTLEGDVGKYQVRHTKHTNGCLIVYSKDSSDAVFVLVVGAYPDYKVAGWIMGKDAKNKKYWQDNRSTPAYFVPQDALLDPTDLEMTVKMRDL